MIIGLTNFRFPMMTKCITSSSGVSRYALLMNGPGGMLDVFKTTVTESVCKRFIFSGKSAVTQWQSVCTWAIK